MSKIGTALKTKTRKAAIVGTLATTVAAFGMTGTAQAHSYSSWYKKDYGHHKYYYKKKCDYDSKYSRYWYKWHKDDCDRKDRKFDKKYYFDKFHKFDKKRHYDYSHFNYHDKFRKFDYRY